MSRVAAEFSTMDLVVPGGATTGLVFTGPRAGLDLDFFADFDFLDNLDEFCRGRFLEL